jgi:serine/threonine protein kinase
MGHSDLDTTRQYLDPDEAFISPLSKAPTCRFEREAKAIAALNHLNICTLYDIGPNYLVMGFIEGTPLHGPLP